MILEEETFESYGYYARDLEPRSGQLVISACTLCGEIRICGKAIYKTFCPNCRKILKRSSKETLDNFKQQRRILCKKQKRETVRNQKNRKKQRNIETKRKEKEEQEREKREDRRALWTFSKKYHGEYCDLFNDEYKRKIRERYDNSCFLCGKCEKDNGQALSVHHVNYDPSCGCDGANCICVPLCISCHSKTNHKRGYWQKKIVRLLAESDYFDT